MLSQALSFVATVGITTASLACIFSLVRQRLIRQHLLVLLFSLVASMFCMASMAHACLGWISRSYYARLYWSVELFEQGFALSLMVHLMRRALANRPQAVLTSQILASIFVVLLSGLLSEGSMSFSSRWMTSFTRNLSFGVAILNFQVWGTIIGERVRAREVLLLAAGLGLLTTGKSLGHTIRLVSSPESQWVVRIGNHIVELTALLASVAWWYAVKPTPKVPGRSSGDKGLQLIKAA